MRAAVWAGLLLLGIYLLTTGGQTFISDGEIMLLTAVRIIDSQTLTLPETAATFPQVVRGHNDFLFSRYGLGQPLIAALCYWIGRYVFGWYLLPGSNDFQVGKFFALLLPSFATAFTGGIVSLWAAQIYRSAYVGILLALLYGVGTLAWPYARFFFSEPLFTACLILAAYAIFQNRPVLSGMAFGYAVATRIGGVLLLPAFLLYAWYKGYRLKRIVLMGMGMIPGALMILANNWVRFHTWVIERGYATDEGFTGHLLVGLYGLLFSPGKSLFLYAPLLIVVPFAIFPFMRIFKPEGLLVSSITLITLLQSAMWWMWWGGWGWGPRFLVPLIPFWVLTIGMLLSHRHWRIMICVLLPISIVINVLGIGVNFNDYLSQFTQGDQAKEMLSLFQPTSSPLLAHLRMFDLYRIPVVSFDLSNPHIGFPRWAAMMFSSGFLLLTIGSMVKLSRLIEKFEHTPSATTNRCRNLLSKERRAIECL